MGSSSHRARRFGEAELSQTIGAYSLDEVIGRGAMGRVWRGAHLRTNDPVAIKILHPELVRESQIIQRFVQERELLCRFDHPHLVKVHDLVVEGGRAAIVMELVNGRDLHAELLRAGTFSPPRAAHIGVQLLGALATVHAAGVVHRDVKPEKILLEDGDVDRVILTDFGVSRIIDAPPMTSITGVIGTPDYLSPEVIDGGPPTMETDVYASGIVLYELLSGFPPFEADAPWSTLRGHVEEAPARPAGLDEELWSLIARMLAKDPVDRPSSVEARAVLEGIEPSLEGKPPLPRQRPVRMAPRPSGIDRFNPTTAEEKDDGGALFKRLGVVVPVVRGSVPELVSQRPQSVQRSGSICQCGSRLAPADRFCDQCGAASR